VGGTSLTRSASARGWVEAAWSNGGSGCSSQIAKPGWQSETSCHTRAEVDVSAVADPATGVAIFTGGSWTVFGGTSAASPIVAAIYTLLGVGSANAALFSWTHPSAFFDVTTGSNGICNPSSLCNAGPGYDGPTGWGTPNGAALAGWGSPP
jgi:subtilase family serine protease